MLNLMLALSEVLMGISAYTFVVLWGIKNFGRKGE